MTPEAKRRMNWKGLHSFEHDGGGSRKEEADVLADTVEGEAS